MIAIRETKWWLVIAAVIALSASHAGAQQYQPFGPVDIRTDMQLFAPVDLGDFGGGTPMAEGAFFSFEKLNWFLPASPTTTLGTGSLVTAHPILSSTITDTTGAEVAYPEGGFGWGSRYEMGYVVDNDGWMVTVLDGPENTSETTFGDPNDGFDNIFVSFNDPDDLQTGFILVDDVPVATIFATTFDVLTIRTRTSVDGVELMKTHRFLPFHRGGVFELYYGARYMKFTDVFDVSTIDGGNMNASFWDTQAINHIIGPQVGGQFVKKQGRWTLTMGGRATAGYNIQQFDQKGTINSSGLINTAGNNSIGQNAFNHRARDEEISTLAELRATWSFQITRSFAVNAGWTGVYASNIARASNVVNYTLPTMGILPGDTEHFFTNGVNFGLEFNR